MELSKLFNVGIIDRVVRAILGLALIALVFIGPQTPWGWLGLILLASATVGICPSYLPFGLSTRAAKKDGNPSA
jgi:hypothetical protein